MTVSDRIDNLRPGLIAVALIVVIGTIRTTSVSRAEGSQFSFRGPFGSQTRWFDCPNSDF